MLYVRKKTVPTIPRKRHWKFRTKLELAARLVRWLAEPLKKAGKTLWVVVDGGYTKQPFLKPALAAGAVVVGRLRKDAALRDLSTEFARLYPTTGRPSIPPEKLLRALLLQLLYSVRSERQLMEQLDYNLLFRWFVGLTMDDPVWDPTVFTKKLTPNGIAMSLKS